MALSEQERKLLEQLEASLMAEDPKLADRLSGSAETRVHRRKAAIAGIGFVFGLAALLLGVQVHPAVSVVGFVVMVAAALLGISSWSRVDGSSQPNSPSGQPKAPPSSPGSDFMSKLDERWRRQQGED